MILAIKAQSTVLPTLLLVAFTTSGFLAILYTSDEVSQHVEYHTGDFNQIAEAKLKADAYEHRTPIELNYSTNIKGFELGDKGGGDQISWDDNIPKYQNDLKPKFLSAVEEHLKTQNRVIGCSKPKIDNINTYDSDKSKFEVKLDNSWVNCTSQVTEASIKTKKILKTHNKPNEYLKLAERSEHFAGKAERKITSIDKDKWDSTETDKECGDKSAARKDANSSAVFGLRSNPYTDIPLFGEIDEIPWNDIADDAYKSTSKPSTFTNLGTDTDVDVQYDVDFNKKGECDEDGDGKNDEKMYEATVTAKVEKINMTFDYQDQETIINSDGDYKHINFRFDYIYRKPYN